LFGHADLPSRRKLCDARGRTSARARFHARHIRVPPALARGLLDGGATGADMNVAKWTLGVAIVSLVGCDLPELNQKPGAGDAGMSGDMARANHMPGDGDMASMHNGGGPDLLMSGGATDMAMMAGTDMADDPSIPNGATIGYCDASRWTITATVAQPVNPATFAIDGLAPTRFSTGAPQTIGQYLQIDFGGFVMLNQVVLQHNWMGDGATDYPRGLDVLVSYDGSDYSRKLASISQSADPGTTTINFTAHAARYLRLQINQTQTTPWWTVHELTLGCNAPGHPLSTAVPDLGAAMGPMNPNIAGWTATASMSAMNTTPAMAFDGNSTTRWSSGKTPQYGDEWFKLDLGQVLPLSQVWLTAAGGDFPGAWEIDLSSDGQSYSVMGRGLGTDTTKMTFATKSARYVMIKQIGSGYAHWWSINELTVY
jgi:hypothetical protein